jgi:hypothetical protein
MLAMEYFVIDEGRVNLSALPGGNPVSHMIRLERGPDPYAFPIIVRELDERFPAPQYAVLRQVLANWIIHSILPWLAPGEYVGALKNLEEVADMSPQAVISWTERAGREGR